jgi:uncharacterized RDD family membrane protein YckC
MQNRLLEAMHPWPLIQPARIWSRWISLSIDWTLLGGFAAVSGLIVVCWFRRLSAADSILLAVVDAPGLLLSLLLLWSAAVVVGCWGYFFFLRALCGWTFGESLWGIRLVRDDGGFAGPKAAFLRELAALVSLAALGAGFWLRFFNAQGRSWHGRMSGTHAVQFWPDDVDPVTGD